MKKTIVLIILMLWVLTVCGCYTPEGGSSIPWNQPESGDGTFTPRVSF